MVGLMIALVACADPKRPAQPEEPAMGPPADTGTTPTTPPDTPPSVTFGAPLQGAIVTGVVALEAEASDDVGVVRRWFEVDGALVAEGTSSSWTAAWSTCGRAAGAARLAAIAEDTTGQLGRAEIAVVVDPDPDGDGLDACGACVGDTGVEEVCHNGVDDDCRGAVSACGLAGAMDAGEPDVVLTTTEPLFYAGTSLVFADLDGDAVPELLAGAWQDWSGLPMSGEVLVLEGPFLGVQPVNDRPRIYGVSFQARVGTALAAGDLDGDGAQELVIGASGFVGMPGAVYIFPAASLTGVRAVTDAPVQLPGLGPYDQAGEEVVIAELDGDGVDDLAVGAPYAQPDGFVRGGAIYLVPGPVHEDAAYSRDALVYGPGEWRYVGYQFCAGDFDDDGHTDLLVGDWATTPPGAAIVTGPIVDARSLNESTDRLGSAAESDEAGFAVGCADLDEDGHTDALIGAPGNAGGAGAAYFTFGPITGMHPLGDVALFAPEDNMRFGNALAVGRVDAGAPALVVTAPSTETAWGTYAGMAYLFASAWDATALSDATGTITGRAAMSLGESVALGDLDGDGFDDVVSSVNTTAGPAILGFVGAGGE